MVLNSGKKIRHFWNMAFARLIIKENKKMQPPVEKKGKK